MQTAEIKTSSAARSQIQAKRQPFFSKEGEGSFFSKSNDATSSFFGPTNLQPKLTIGQPNDKYEVEADTMADKVVQRLSTGNDPIHNTGVQGNNAIQRKCHDCEQEEQVQKKEEPLLNGITKIQRKPIFESNAEQPEADVQTKPLSIPVIQAKCSACQEEEKLQRKEEEDELQENEMGIQTKSRDTPGEASPNLQNRLNSSKGRGSSLSSDVQTSMGSAFGTDFNNVRVHTGREAVQMNKEIGAQAFTHGSDIYFNSGKYDTSSSSGQHLLAHELTHTMQQGAAPKKIQRRQFGPGAQGVPSNWRSDVSGASTAAARFRLNVRAIGPGVSLVHRTRRSLHDASPNPAHLEPFRPGNKVNYIDNLHSKSSVGGRRSLQNNAGYTLHSGGNDYVVLGSKALKANNFYHARIVLNHEFDHVRQRSSGRRLRYTESELDAWTTSFIREFHRTYTLRQSGTRCYVDGVSLFAPLSMYYRSSRFGGAQRTAVNRISAYYRSVLRGHAAHDLVFRYWLYLSMQGGNRHLSERLNRDLSLNAEVRSRPTREIPCSAVTAVDIRFPAPPRLILPSRSNNRADNQVIHRKPGPINNSNNLISDVQAKLASKPMVQMKYTASKEQGGFGSNSEKHLLAHELTHVIQQNGISTNSELRLKLNRANSLIQKEDNKKSTPYLSSLLFDLEKHLEKATRKNKKKWQIPDFASKNLQDLENYLVINSIDNEESRKHISQRIRQISEESWNNFLDHVDTKQGIVGLSDDEKNVYKNALKKLDNTKKAFRAANKNEAYSKYLAAAKIALSDPYYFYYHIVYGLFTPSHLVTLRYYNLFMNPNLSYISKKADLLEKVKGMYLVYFSIQTFISKRLARKIGLAHSNFIEKLPSLNELPKRKSGLKKRKRRRRTKKKNESFSDFRKTKMRPKYRRLFKKLPKWMRKKGMADPEVTANLDRMVAMSRYELKEFLEFLKTRGKSEPKHQDVADQTEDKEQDQNSKEDSIDPPNKKSDQPQGDSESQKTQGQEFPETSKVLSEEFEILKKLKEIAKNSGDPMDAESQAKILELLKSFSPEQLEAFFQFVKEHADAVATEKASSEDVIKQFKTLTPAQIEQQRLAKIFSETVDPKGFTEEDIKQASFSFNTTKETQEEIRNSAKRSNNKINEIKTKIAIALQDLEDQGEITQEISKLKPFDPKDFEISLEMLMVKGILLGAGKMSPGELEPETQKLARQIDSIPQMIKELLWDIEKELIAHAVTSAIPLVGWAKAVVTAIRVSRLVKRMNDLRKAAKRIKKAYNIYLKIRKAIKTAQGVFEKAKGFVSKFESIKNTWKSLQKKMENLEAADSTDEQLELIFDELMEMMEGKMDALEPFLEKLYIPEDAIDDPEKLIEILFNIPLGVREFGKLYQLYSNAGAKDSDSEFQLVIFYKSIAVGGLLYPFIGFMIDVIGDTLVKIAESLQRKLKENFTGLKDKKKKSKQKGKKGRFRSLWSRGYVYKDGKGKNPNGTEKNPAFQNALNKAYIKLKEDFPEEPGPSKWDLGLRLSLRLKLRKFIKAQNKSRQLAKGRPKKEKGPGWQQVPIPKLKYKLSRKANRGYFEITLKINPIKVHRVKAFTMKIFDKGIVINNFGSTGARNLRKWLQKGDYELNQVGRRFWHVRRKDKLRSKRGLPYLILKGNTVTTGLSGKDPTLVDKFIDLNMTIKNSSQVPEGYYVSQGGRKVGRTVHHKYVYLMKKRGIGKMNPEGLYIDEKSKLQKGLKEKTHSSRFIIVRYGKYMLGPKYRKTSKKIRNVFYGKSYNKAVMDMKAEILNKPFTKGGLQDPLNKNKYYGFDPDTQKKVGPFSKKVKPGHPNYPTLDHEPPVAQHWNQKGGRNSKQSTRKTYYNFKNILNTTKFRKLVTPWKINSSKGSGGKVFNFIVGKKFRGPGEENK